MIIRIDKCSTFVIKKALTKSIQFLLKLLINNWPAPTVKIGESFKCLERFFDYNMSNEEHKLELISLVNELLSDIVLALNFYIQKTNFYCTADMLYSKYRGISQLRPCRKRG